MQFTPEGTRLVTCSSDGMVKLIELGGSEIFSVNLREPLQYAHSFFLWLIIYRCLTTDGELLLLGGADGILRIWTLKSGAEIKQIKSSEPISTISCSTNGSLVVLGSGSSIRVHKNKL